MNTTWILSTALVILAGGPPSGPIAWEAVSLAVESEAWPATSLSRQRRLASPDSVRSLVETALATDDSDRRKDLLLEAERLARVELAQGDADPDRRYTLAIALGARANTEGGKARIRAAAEMREELVSILEMDPGHAGAHHLLGRLHAAVRRMSGLTRWVAINLLGGTALEEATWEAAEEHLAFAEAAAPEVLDHHLQLALLYRDTGRPELALEEIDHLTTLQAAGAVDRLVLAEAMEVRARLSTGQ